MFSIVIATRDSERALVPTLAALVPGATAGIVREVIVADGGSRDSTEEVAEIAGCHFLVSSEPLGARLKAAVQNARSDWLMFLRPGVVPGVTWIDETIAFADTNNSAVHAAVFAPERDFSLFSYVFRGVLGISQPEQGLIIRKSFYQALGGHRAADANPEKSLLRRIGRRRLVTLRTAISRTDI